LRGVVSTLAAQPRCAAAKPLDVVRSSNVTAPQRRLRALQRARAHAFVAQSRESVSGVFVSPPTVAPIDSRSTLQMLRTKRAGRRGARNSLRKRLFLSDCNVRTCRHASHRFPATWRRCPGMAVAASDLRWTRRSCRPSSEHSTRRWRAPSIVAVRSPSARLLRETAIRIPRARRSRGVARSRFKPRARRARCNFLHAPRSIETSPATRVRRHAEQELYLQRFWNLLTS